MVLLRVCVIKTNNVAVSISVRINAKKRSPLYMQVSAIISIANSDWIRVALAISDE